MKFNPFKAGLFAAVAAAAILAGACAEPVPTSRRPDDTGVIGQYVVKHGKKDPACSIQFNRNGTFDADFNGDGENDTAGTFKVTRNRLSLVNTSGVVCKGLRGVYVYSLDQNVMTFTEEVDDCGVRKTLFRKKWILQ